MQQGKERGAWCDLRVGNSRASNQKGTETRKYVPTPYTRIPVFVQEKEKAKRVASCAVRHQAGCKFSLHLIVVRPVLSYSHPISSRWVASRRFRVILSCKARFPPPPPPPLLPVPAFHNLRPFLLPRAAGVGVVGAR